MNEPWFDPNMLGAVLGSIFGIVGGGIYGPLIGSCAPQGKCKWFVFCYHFTLLAASIGLVGVGGYAWLVGQPFGVWFTLAGIGILGVVIFGALTPVLFKRYRDAESVGQQTQEL